MDGRRNFRINVEGTDNEELKKELTERRSLDLKNLAYIEFVEKFALEELEKTKFEKKLIEEAIVATKAVLNDLKLKKFADHLDIRVEDVHVISPKQYKQFQNVDEIEHPAFFTFGHIFLMPNKDKVDFVHGLTHELGHAVQFSEYTMNVDESDNPNEPNFSGSMVRTSFGGRVLGETGTRIFHGLTEICAEQLAIGIRQEFNSKNKDLTTKEKKELRYTYVYDPLLNVMHAFIDDIAKSPDEATQIWQELLRDNITGSYAIINWLETKHPGATKILSEITDKYESAQLAAEKLGLKEAAKEIAKDIEDLKKSDTDKQE